MNDETLLNAMEEASGAVAVWTGIKQKFIDSGWSPDVAEQMTLEMIRHT